MLCDINLMDISEFKDYPDLIEIVADCLENKQKCNVPGIYQIYSFNPKSYVKDNIDDFFLLSKDCQIFYQKDSDSIFKAIRNGVELLNPYGVCDDYTQILQHYNFDATNNKFVLFLTPVHRNPNEPYSGWRWEKWGEYIGTKKPQHDYLNDEPDIELVYVYSIYEIMEG